MNIGFLAYCRFPEVDWSRCGSSRYPYDFDMGLVRSVESTVEPGRQYLNEGATMTDCKLMEWPIIFVKGESMTLWEAKSQLRQLFATRYRADLEECSAVAPEEVVRTNMLAGDLKL